MAGFHAAYVDVLSVERTRLPMSDAGAVGSISLGTAPGRWVVLATVLGSALAGIDATVVNIALPAIGRNLHASFGALQWTVTGYTVTLAALILFGGALGDRFGRRRIFCYGVGWFAVGSALCAAAPSIIWLVAARTLQGVGGALLTPASLAIIQSDFRREDRAGAVGIWAGFGGVATAIAPFVGGGLLAVGSWRWVFLINLPLAVVVIVIARRHVPDTRDPAAASRLDWRGAALGVAGLATLTYAIIGAPEQGLSVPVGITGVLGISAVGGFMLVEKREKSPMLPLGIFHSRQFSVANAATFLIYGSIGVFFFLIVIHLQVVAGYTPLRAGAALLPVTILTLLLSPASGKLAQRIGPRPQMTVGPLLCALAALMCLRLSPNASYLTDALPAIAVFGLGLACFVAPLTAAILAGAPTEHAGIASGVNNAVARTGSLLAISAIPALTGLTGKAYDDPTQFLRSFRVALVIAAGLLAVAAGTSAVGLRQSTTNPSQVPATPDAPQRRTSSGAATTVRHESPRAEETSRPQTASRAHRTP